MRLAELGERKAIEIISSLLDRAPDAFPPIGDDVAGWRLGGGLLAILKTDMLVASTDIPPGMTYYQAARKAVVMNVSDMAAKGARPLAILASLGLPGGLAEEDLSDIARGLNDAARRYGAFIVGGDTNECGELVICCSLFGLCHEDELVPRSGARPGDILATTGGFGLTYLGLKALLEGIELSGPVREAALKAVLMPEARLEVGLALARAGVLSSSVDSSDGLAWSLHELSRASGVGFLVEEMPLAPGVEEEALRLGLDPFEACFYGGEEYEIVMTVRPDGWEEAVEAARRAGVELKRMGRAVGEPGIWLREPDGNLRPIEAGGWEHFRSGRHGDGHGRDAR
ncbi:thiamine-phosphate kinase [Candidatus Bathyarchaeota archaeon]|nr:MAG: thiamine-phosphate kinase [Candidatus Bathyarchaeota archaeon]